MDKVWLAIAVMSVVTASTRFIPFLVFGGKGKTPKFVDKLGRSLPYAIMAMLVVYCLKGTTFTTMSGYVPQIICCGISAGLYIWKKNTLLSIITATIAYMVLVQTVF